MGNTVEMLYNDWEVVLGNNSTKAIDDLNKSNFSVMVEVKIE